MLELTIKNNELIRNYFKGSDEYIPIAEFMYLHEHPLIRESFMSEIEISINKASIVLEKKNIKGKVLDDFINLTKKLGALCSDINQDNAPLILNELRDIYKLCNHVNTRLM